jgi:hypothetical protein
MDTSEVTRNTGSGPPLLPTFTTIALYDKLLSAKISSPLAVSDGKIKVPSGLEFRVAHVVLSPKSRRRWVLGGRGPAASVRKGGRLPTRSPKARERPNRRLLPRTGKRGQPNWITQSPRRR